jgi:hypothetical protein
MINDIAHASEVRLQLIHMGFTPIPLFGKAPPSYRTSNSRRSFTGWQRLRDVTPEMIQMWARVWPDASNTGILCFNAPALDLDLLNEPAAIAVENLVRGRFGDDGPILVRIGNAPKRALFFQCSTPFNKLVLSLPRAQSDGSLSAEKVEFLADGQLVVVEGIHPQTQRPYAWHGGRPWGVRRTDLPMIDAVQAHMLMLDIMELLTTEHGYTTRTSHTALSTAKAAHAPDLSGPKTWDALVATIIAGAELHDSLRDLAAKLVKSGMHTGAAVHLLRALMMASTCPHDTRWTERFDGIPRAVNTAVRLLEAARQATSD